MINTFNSFLRILTHMVFDLIGSAVSFVVKTTLYVVSFGVVVGGVVIYTKPDTKSFNESYDQYIKSKAQQNVPGMSGVVGSVFSSGLRSVSNVEHNDCVFFRTATVTRPEHGPVFVGALGQWFCVQEKS